MTIGIERIAFYIPQYYLPLSELAARHEIDADKFSRGIGQDKIAMPCHDEDIVTMGAEAAQPILDACGRDHIDTILFATETGIDQSKAAGIYVHKLLKMHPQCRVVELKQACYSSTAALQMACGLVARKPASKILVIASDISRYDLNSSGEATQGAGAIAMLISSTPDILEIDVATGTYCEDIMDFWRPNYRKTPLVDGKYSAMKYMQSLAHSWKDYQKNGGRDFTAFTQFCYHLPFTRMAEKAHKHLCTLNNQKTNPAHIEAGMTYTRDIGNCYSAALYLSFISMLENFRGDLAGKPIGLFSYGSGATAEFFSGLVQCNYRDALLIDHHHDLLSNRHALGYDDYLSYWNTPDVQSAEEVIMPAGTRGRYRLATLKNHKRYYEDTAQEGAVSVSL